MNPIEELSKALEVGSYNSAPGNLMNGSALQVESLDVVMRSVVFTEANFIDNKKLARLLRNLDQRHIPYQLISRKLNKRQIITFSWNKKLIINKRVFLFRTGR